MKSNERLNSEFQKVPKNIPQVETNSTNSITVYTGLCILRSMKTRLGLEAMLEYMEEYLLTIERNNPRLKDAASKVMSMISVEKIYKDAVK